MPAETATAICCMTMGGVLERFPGLKVCFAHGGMPLCWSRCKGSMPAAWLAQRRNSVLSVVNFLKV